MNDLKRSFLYINLWREFDLQKQDAGMPSREERFWKLARFVASNRGQGAFHARGMMLTLFQMTDYQMADYWEIPLDKEKNGAGADRSFG